MMSGSNDANFGLDPAKPLWQLIPTLALGYSSVINGTIAVLFKLEWGMFLLGKDKKSGKIPLWSYAVFFPFHFPNQLYTYLHTIHGTQKIQLKDSEKLIVEHVPVASEVQRGWWLGGCYAHQLNRDWACIIDLTTEFEEKCINRTKTYKLVATWDGVPATPAQLEESASFAVNARKQYGGDVLVHCAHGRGRSTTVMCACLVKAGLFSSWDAAFEKGIKPYRPVAKLNRRMRQNLAEWQSQYVDRDTGKAQ